eukprot:g81730.t1
MFKRSGSRPSSRVETPVASPTGATSTSFTSAFRKSDDPVILPPEAVLSPMEAFDLEREKPGTKKKSRLGWRNSLSDRRKDKENSNHSEERETKKDNGASSSPNEDLKEIDSDSTGHKVGGRHRRNLSRKARHVKEKKKEKKKERKRDKSGEDSDREIELIELEIAHWMRQDSAGDSPTADSSPADTAFSSPTPAGPPVLAPSAHLPSAADPAAAQGGAHQVHGETTADVHNPNPIVSPNSLRTLGANCKLIGGRTHKKKPEQALQDSVSNSSILRLAPQLTGAVAKLEEALRDLNHVLATTDTLARVASPTELAGLSPDAFLYLSPGMRSVYNASPPDLVLSSSTSLPTTAADSPLRRGSTNLSNQLQAGPNAALSPQPPMSFAHPFWDAKCPVGSFPDFCIAALPIPAGPFPPSGATTADPEGSSSANAAGAGHDGLLRSSNGSSVSSSSSSVSSSSSSSSSTSTSSLPQSSSSHNPPSSPSSSVISPSPSSLSSPSPPINFAVADPRLLVRSYVEKLMAQGVWAEAGEVTLPSPPHFWGMARVVPRKHWDVLQSFLAPGLPDILDWTAHLSTNKSLTDAAENLWSVSSFCRTSLGLVRALVAREVSVTNQPAQLFRTNSLVSKLWQLMANTDEGKAYVKLTLNPAVQKLIRAYMQQPHSSSHTGQDAWVSFEINPRRLAREWLTYHRLLTARKKALEEAETPAPSPPGTPCSTMSPPPPHPTTTTTTTTTTTCGPSPQPQA